MLQPDQRAIALMVAQLGRIAYGDGPAAGLTHAQWTALRYFHQANRFSRTTSAFAEFHGTTRGTASQTVKGLEARGLVKRKRCERDGRSSRFDLTGRAIEILADDPIHALVNAVRALPPDIGCSLEHALGRVLGHVARQHGKRPFGLCGACYFLEGVPKCKGRASHSCGLLGEGLADEELEQLCINFEPGPESAMKHTLRGSNVQ